MNLRLCALLIMGTIVPCAPLHAEESGFATARLEALITDPDLDEISGIAPSRKRDDVFWVHNDSPRPARLEAIDIHGRHLASLRIEGITSYDWEDIASYELDGRAWLLIGDIGDNSAARPWRELIAVEEPELRADQQELTGKPAWRLRFTFADGAHDCEAMTVDAKARQVYLVNKHAPLQVYRLPLAPPADVQRPLQAESVASLGGIPQPASGETKARFPAARYGGSPTAMDIDTDGRRAIVLTYRDLWLYTRAGDESWAQAFARGAEKLPLPPLAQAEAASFDRAGSSILVSSERLPAPLLRLPPAIPQP